MALIRTVVPDLIGGVSKQPDVQRFMNQFEEVDNASLLFNRGFEKRNGTTFIKNITDPTGDMKIHWINRSATQRYFILFRANASTPVRIFKASDGSECTVNYQTGKSTSLKAYLNIAPANIRAVTFDDTTIVANTTITTATTTTTATYRYPTASANAADDVIKTNPSPNPHNKAYWTEFNLPPTAVDEYWYARNDSPGNPQGFYKSISTTTQPWYQRIRTPWTNSEYDATTMPVRIVQTNDTTFEVKEIEWIARLSGDGLTNPPASFVGKKIADIAIHRNRFWIAAGERIVSSQAGSYFNFWYNTYTQLVDSDPIDLTLGSSQVSTIKHIIPFQKSLVVFTDSNQQYEVKARDALTPTTVSVIPSTTYASPELCKPLIVGSYMYWVTNKGEYSQVFEYASDSLDTRSTAMDITAHCDTYIPPDMTFMSASSSSDIIIIGDGNTNAMYVNFAFYQGQKKLQNAWCKYSMGDDGTNGKIISANFFDDTIYVLQRVPEGGGAVTSVLRLNKLECRTLDEYPSYLPRIDAKQLLSAGTWVKANQQTEWVVPGRVLDANVIFFGSEWNAHTEDREGYWIVPDEIEDQEDDPPTMIVRVNGKYDDYPVWLGVNFETNCQISRQYVRDRNQMPMVGTLTLKNMSVCHRDTGYYEIHIDPKITPQATRIVQYVPKTVGSNFILGENDVSDNQIETFKIMSSANNVTLNIKSNQPPPLNINAIEFATNFVEKKTSPADR